MSEQPEELDRRPPWKRGYRLIGLLPGDATDEQIPAFVAAVKAETKPKPHRRSTRKEGKNAQEARVMKRLRRGD